MGDSFLVQFFKKWKQVGAISPSSIFLVEDMLSEIDFNRAQTIVELGAGSGSFTKQILKKMRSDARLIVFEIDDVFIKKLSRIKDPRMELVQDSAEHLSRYLSGEADYIVSGIPLSNLDKKVKEGIIAASQENLSTGGLFLQFQYFPESLHVLKDYFDSVKLRFTLLNTPPAFFYICKK
jgi:phospholipid N-methyltransferase